MIQVAAPLIQVMTSRKSRHGGFSLIEMLMVVAIIGLLATFIVPAVSTIVKGTALTQAASQVVEQISLARQYAVTKNRTVEVRFIKYADRETPGESATDVSSGKFRAIQLLEVFDSGILSPLDKIRPFPNTVMIDPSSLSTLLNSSNSNQKVRSADPASDVRISGGVDTNYQFASFRFLPNGGTTLSPTDNWFLTLRNVTDPTPLGTLPRNFFTLQIDPANGTTKGYRPGLK